MQHFQHDCTDRKCCKFVGHVDGRSGMRYDVWVSKKGGELILRFGNADYQYICYDIRHSRGVRPPEQVVAALALIDDEISWWKEFAATVA